MRDETQDRVRKRVAEVLALQPEEVRTDASLVDDLGADSLDLVDLMFTLEKEFGITLKRQDLSLTAQLGIPEEEVHRNEILTPKALMLLRGRFPMAAEKLPDGITRKHLAVLLTVEEISRAVGRKLAEVSPPDQMRGS
jgi:acyl carrier protein